MKSGLARLRPRNTAPVPMGGNGTFTSYQSMPLGSDRDEALLRTYNHNGTVQANVSLLASSTAGPAWKLFRTAPQDGRVRYTTSDQGSDQRVEVVQHQALNVLNKPASMVLNGREIVFWTRFALFELSQIWMDLTGKSTWVVEYGDHTTFPLGLWPVRPDRLTPVPDAKNYLKGWIYRSPNGTEKIPLEPHEVIYNRYPNPMDIYGGIGPVGSVLTDIEAANSGAEWNRNFFLNSALPGGVLQADHELNDTEYDQLTNRWREAHRGVSRAHRIALLEAGVTWVQTHQSMKDMDFSNLRLSSRDIIRESLGMHKVMTGVTDDVNRANAQTGEEVFSSWKVKPRLERWRDVLNHQFLPLFGSTGQGVEFDFILPVPRNREEDRQELLAKAQASLDLVTAGFDQHDVLEAVGWPDMSVALQLSSQPALPPRWTVPAPPGQLGGPPAAAPAARHGRHARPALTASWQPVPELTAGKDPASAVYKQQSKDYPAHAMAWMHHATWKGPVKVPLDHIEPDMRWMDGADPDHVQDFVKRIKAGKKLKPVVLVACPGSSKLQLIDGHHRYLACAEMDVPCRGYIGTVKSKHGDWETMHDYQLDHGPEHGSKASLMREMAAWNALGARR